MAKRIALTKDPITGKPRSEYIIWQGMIRRCYDPRRNTYKFYGAKGISVCTEWRASFAAFLAHIGPRPGKQYSVDRINGKGNYEPGNVRWATQEEQRQNTSFKWKPIELQGKLRSVRECSRIVGINYGTLLSRIRSGWPVSEAVSIPVEDGGNKFRNKRRYFT